MSRLLKGYASAFRADQAQRLVVRRQQTRTLTVDWNGAIPVDATIQSVNWQCTSPWITHMSQPAISGKETTVMVDFNYWGAASIKATIQASDGSQQVYQFDIEVRMRPLFPYDTYGTANGPYTVTATV